jgi:hypothetical protein
MLSRGSGERDGERARRLSQRLAQMLLELRGDVDAQAPLVRPVIGEQERVVRDAETEVAALDDPVEVTGPGFGQRRNKRILFGQRRRLLQGGGVSGLPACDRSGEAKDHQDPGDDLCGRDESAHPVLLTRSRRLRCGRSNDGTTSENTVVQRFPQQCHKPTPDASALERHEYSAPCHRHVATARRRVATRTAAPPPGSGLAA